MGRFTIVSVTDIQLSVKVIERAALCHWQPKEIQVNLDLTFDQNVSHEIIDLLLLNHDFASQLKNTFVEVLFEASEGLEGAHIASSLRPDCSIEVTKVDSNHATFTLSILHEKKEDKMANGIIISPVQGVFQ